MFKSTRFTITLGMVLLFTIFNAQGQSIFVEHSIDATYRGAAAIDIKDLNNDGKLDIVAASHGTPTAPHSGVKCWINNGPSPVGFTGQIIDAGYQSIACYAEDLNGDGFTDAIAGSWTANSIVYWLNSGSSPIVWTKYTLSTGFKNTHGVYAGDFDGDGDNDILGAAAGDNEISIWINDGGTPISWTRNVITTSFSGVRSVHGGDIDEDGDLDFVATAMTSNELAWWRNDGGSPISWTKFTLSTEFVGAHWAIFSDIDGDSHLDILGAAWADNEVSWWRNNLGDPVAWTKYSIDTTFSGVFFATPADFDNDGDIDVFATSQPANKQAYYINNGGSPFTWTRHYLTSSNSQPWPAAPLHVDGDGSIDIVSGGNAMLGWWENISAVPLPPMGFTAQSDPTTPTSISLAWHDPSMRTDSNTLAQYSIHLYRGSSLIAAIDSGIQQYTDTQLVNHQIYSYSIRAVTPSESSQVVTASAYAGGCPYAFPPTSFIVRDTATGIHLQWKNPARNIDGSPLIDTFFVMIYREGALFDSLEQTHLDTGQVRHYYDTSKGYHQYQLRIRDKDSIPHYSSWTSQYLGYGGVPEKTLLQNFEPGCSIPYHTGTWDTTQSLALRSKYCFTDSPIGDTPNYSNVSFLLPPLSVDDTLIMTFFDITIVAPGNYGNTVNIEVSNDSRNTFSKLASYNWNDYELWQDGVADSIDWRREVFDLTPYIGDTITIRFRLNTISGMTSDGWYIDSIRVQPPDLPDPPDSTRVGVISLRSGWNMVSLPLRTEDMDKTTIFSSASSFAFTYKYGYVICESLQTGTGYWIKYDAPKEIIIEGELVPSDTIGVSAGWNMVGALNADVVVADIETYPPDLSCSEFFEYDSVYRSADTLTPGKGYWVRTNKNGVLTLNASVDNGVTSKIKIIQTGEQPPHPPFEEKTVLASPGVPDAFDLMQNYPNPFNPTTTIAYDLTIPSRVLLRIYDLLGHQVETLVDGIQSAGEWKIEWHAEGMASGIYFCHLDVIDSQSGTRIYHNIHSMFLIR